ncbi:MAG TPA: response regulator, partial [Edaphobacter sp.]|nr:response regulator [Edaphobacter sp.]
MTVAEQSRTIRQAEMMASAGARTAAAGVAEAPLTGTPDQREQFRINGLHVLVVDDDAAIRQTCSAIAEGMGCAVVGAGTITHARRILKLRKVDVVLLDLKLPDGGGLALLEQVNALYPDTAVVVMTAFATVSSAV